MVAISGKPMRLGERLGEPLGPARTLDSVVSRVLRFDSLSQLARRATYMFQPGHATRSTGNRHYLLINNRWVDPTTLDTSMGAMVGTMTADGTGGSLSYTPEIVAPTTVEAISILYTNTNVVVPILSMGFNRALTAGERTSLSSLITPIATAAGVSPASCSLVTGQEFQQRVLKMKVNTALAGSANDTFILPAAGSGTYAYTVDWGNGSREYVTANTAQTKDYDATSTFIVKVYGTYRPFFNDGGDKAKLLIAQLGSTGVTNHGTSFRGCSALTRIVGYANTADVTSFYYTFENCTALISTTITDTAKATTVERMFSGCTALKQSLAAFNLEACTSLLLMLQNCNINETGTTTNYDATLIAWAAQDLQDSKTFTATNCKYGDAGEVARTAIANDDLWTFVDGGHI